MRAERGSDVIIVLVGNKTDLNDKRQVTSEEGEQKAKEMANVMFMETSAKAGYNVKLLFKRIAQALPGVSTGSGQAGTADGQQPTQNQVIDISKPAQPESTESQCAC